MRWVAPTEKDDANHQLEKKLWDAADQFRALYQKQLILAYRNCGTQFLSYNANRNG